MGETGNTSIFTKIKNVLLYVPRKIAGLFKKKKPEEEKVEEIETEEEETEHKLVNYLIAHNADESLTETTESPK